MCSVTFVPVQDGFIFTSNRDERVNRATSIDFVMEKVNNENIYFPKDKEAGGTWFAYSSKNVVCLLNGAFKKHQRKPSYRISRGKLVLDTFNFDSFFEFCTQTNFQGVEPFTMISISLKDLKIQELRWDENDTHLVSLDCKRPKIWSSTTLYSDEVIQNREREFQKLVDKLNTSQSILNYHIGQGEFLNQNLLLDLGDKATVSTTQIVVENVNVKANYYPLLEA